MSKEGISVILASVRRDLTFRSNVPVAIRRSICLANVHHVFVPKVNILMYPVLAILPSTLLDVKLVLP